MNILQATKYMSKASAKSLTHLMYQHVSCQPATNQEKQNTKTVLMNTIFWTAYSNDERHSAINKLQNVVSTYGDIVDTKFFSDISLNIRIEIEVSKIDKLYDALRMIVGIDKFEYLNSDSKKESVIFLNVTFNKGTGNLKIEVPSVPG